MKPSLPVPSKKKNLWFGRIDTKEAALKIIKCSSYCCFFIAAMFAIVGFFIRLDAWFDVIIYLIIGGILLKFKSRIVAILLLLFIIDMLIGFFIEIILNPASRDDLITNPFWAVIIIMVWVSVRVIQATFKLNKLEKNTSPRATSPI